MSVEAVAVKCAAFNLKQNPTGIEFFRFAPDLGFCLLEGMALDRGAGLLAGFRRAADSLFPDHYRS